MTLNTTEKSEYQSVEKHSRHLHGEFADGLRYTHFRSDANTSKILEMASYFYTTLELLFEKGVIDEEEFVARRKAMTERLIEEYTRDGLGMIYRNQNAGASQNETDIVIDCENRVHQCQAACCKLKFALSREDVEAGVIRWDFGQPYLIAREPDQYCTHLDRAECACTIHPGRPAPCRQYDCRSDRRIWLDFDKRIVNPSIHEPSWPEGVEQDMHIAAPNPASRKANGGVIHQPHPPAAEAKDNHFIAILNGMMARLTAKPLYYQSSNRVVSAHGVFLSLGVGISAFAWLFLVGSRFQYPLPPWYHLLGMLLAVFIGSKMVAISVEKLATLLKQKRNYRGGHTFYGGILGPLIYGGFFWAHDLPSLMLYIDCVAPAIGLGYAITKLGCLSYGCCIGPPTGGRLRVVYTEDVSKAVGYYRLKNIPLLPIQVYELLFGLAQFIILSILPSAMFGSGQIMGLFLLTLIIGRIILFNYRYRFPDEHAGSLISWVLNVIFVSISLVLISTALFSLTDLEMAVKGSAPSASIIMLVIVSTIISTVTFLLFGLRRID